MTETVQEDLVVSNCVLSPDEIHYLRSLSCEQDVNDQVTALQNDIFCENTKKNEQIAVWLWVDRSKSNEEIVAVYGDLLWDAEKEKMIALFIAIDQLWWDPAERQCLKNMLFIRWLIAQRQKKQSEEQISPWEEICDMSIEYLDIEHIDTAYDLKKQIFSVSFLKALWWFQQGTNSDADCLVGPKTLRNLVALLPVRPTKEGLVQRVQVKWLEEYTEQLSIENKQQEYLCAWYTNAVLTNILHLAGKTYKFPQKEGSAREKDTDLCPPYFEKKSLGWLSQEEIVAALRTCPAGTTLTVQNSRSSHQAEGVTHTLIYLWWGCWWEMIGSEERIISNIWSLVQKDPATGIMSIQRGEGHYYRLIRSEWTKVGSTLYTPQLDKMKSVKFRTLTEEELTALKERCGGDKMAVAKYLAQTYGWSYMYYLSFFGTSIENAKTIQIPLSAGEKKVALSAVDTLVYKNNAVINKKPFAKMEAVWEKAGIWSLPDEYAVILERVFTNEWRKWVKRKLAEWYLSSDMYRSDKYAVRAKNPLNGIVNVGLGMWGQEEFVTQKKDLMSLWAFQIHIDVFKNLVQNPVIQKNLQAILRAQWRRTWDDLETLWYEGIRKILRNKPAALYLAYELCKQNKSILHKHAADAGKEIRKPDILLTTQFMHNKWVWATYGAILQQELYKIAKQHNCSPPTSFVFDGVGWAQTDALVDCLRDFLGSDVKITKTEKWVITHFNDISVQDIAWLQTFFSSRQKVHDYYPALDMQFLQQVSGIRASYVTDTLHNTKRIKRIQLYTWTEELWNNRRVNRLRDLCDSSQVNYRRAAIDADKALFNPRTGEGNLDCIDLVKLYHAKKWHEDWREYVNPRIQNKTDFTDMFANAFSINAYVTPEIYQKTDRYKNMLYNVQIGDTVGIWHERPWGQEIPWIDKVMSINHWGIVSKILRDETGAIVNVGMIHASWTDDLWGEWPQEVMLFWPWGYYETTCAYNDAGSTKDTIVFGSLQRRKFKKRPSEDTQG